MRKLHQQEATENTQFGPWLAEETKHLRIELSKEHSKMDDVTSALARKQEQADRAEKAHAEARVEYDALVAANEALRYDLALMKDKVDADRQGSRGAESELGEL